MTIRTELPWDLDLGIRFEDEDRILRWGTDIRLLQSVGRPSVNDRTSSVHITWPRRRVFGGLLADVGATQIREEPAPRAFHLYLPTVHWFSLEVCEKHDDPARAHQQLRELHDRMVEGLGAATFCYPDYSHSLPGIFWERGRVTISIGPKLGRTSLGCTIQHDPDGYGALQAEAARIRAEEGEGARVDHVVWPDD